MSPRSWTIRLSDIVTAIDEAVVHIPDEIKNQHPEVQWNRIKGMRNKITHEYFSVDESQGSVQPAIFSIIQPT